MGMSFQQMNEVRQSSAACARQTVMLRKLAADPNVVAAGMHGFMMEDGHTTPLAVDAADNLVPLSKGKLQNFTRFEGALYGPFEKSSWGYAWAGWLAKRRDFTLVTAGDMHAGKIHADGFYTMPNLEDAVECGLDFIAREIIDIRINLFEDKVLIDYHRGHLLLKPNTLVLAHGPIWQGETRIDRRAKAGA